MYIPTIVFDCVPVLGGNTGLGKETIKVRCAPTIIHIERITDIPP